MPLLDLPVCACAFECAQTHAPQQVTPHAPVRLRRWQLVYDPDGTPPPPPPTSAAAGSKRRQVGTCNEDYCPTGGTSHHLKTVPPPCQEYKAPCMCCITLQRYQLCVCSVLTHRTRHQHHNTPHRHSLSGCMGAPTCRWFARCRYRRSPPTQTPRSVARQRAITRSCCSCASPTRYRSTPHIPNMVLCVDVPNCSWTVRAFSHGH